MKGYFEKTLLPTPYTVLGKALKPFSIGHFLILRRFNVGIVSDGLTQRTVDDLIFSVFVCCHTYAECRSLLYSGNWDKDIQEWAIQFQDQPINWGEQYLLFDRYISEQTDLPHFHVLTGNNSTGNKHYSDQWYKGVIAWLANGRGYTRDQVMDLPFNDGFYQYLSNKEENGIILFYTDTLEERVREREKQSRDELLYGKH